jgi:hypothetical protein
MRLLSGDQLGEMSIARWSVSCRLERPSVRPTKMSGAPFTDITYAICPPLGSKTPR